MKSLNRTLTAALLTGCATSAIAQEDPVFNLIAPDNSFSMGVGYLGGERQQLGVYDDLNGSQLVFLLAADINTRDDATGTWFTLSGHDLGILNRTIDLGYERQGNWGAEFDYSRIPYVAPYTVNSGITGYGTETQTVPVGPAYVPGTGRYVHLSTERERIGTQFFKYLNRPTKLTFGFRNEDKTGPPI